MAPLLATGGSRYFYPRSPCGERRVTVLGIQHRVGISIHALLAESDNTNLASHCRNNNFYPRSPCGERLRVLDGSKSSIEISIHALLAESDPENPMIRVNNIPFLSTLSLRRATAPHGRKKPPAGDFYPRSPCGERLLWPVHLARGLDFYPRSPCGERQAHHKEIHHQSQFLSTLSLRRAT